MISDTLSNFARRLSVTVAIGALSLTMAYAPRAEASTVVFSNDVPAAGSSGNEATQWVQTGRFTVAGNTALTGGGVYIADQLGPGALGGWDGSLNYWIFSDAAGQPGAALGSGAAAGISTTDTGTAWCCGGNMFLVDFDFASAIDVLAGATYYRGIHLANNFIDRDDIYWVRNGSGPGFESAGGTFNNWFNNGFSKAFYLRGDPVVPIPLPAALPLLAVGLALLGGIGAARRRKA